MVHSFRQHADSYPPKAISQMPYAISHKPYAISHKPYAISQVNAPATTADRSYPARSWAARRGTRRPAVSCGAPTACGNIAPAHSAPPPFLDPQHRALSDTGTLLSSPYPDPGKPALSGKIENKVRPPVSRIIVRLVLS